MSETAGSAMPATSAVPGAPEVPKRVRNKPNWYLLYFLLAALDVITVLVSLGLNHQLMEIYSESVEVNQVWAARLSTYADIAAIASEANAPGNDVFDSRDVKLESARMQ